MATLRLVAPKDDATRYLRSCIAALVEAAATLSHHSTVR